VLRSWFELECALGLAWLVRQNAIAYGLGILDDSTNGEHDLFHLVGGDLTDPMDKALSIKPAQLKHINRRRFGQAVDRVWIDPHMPDAASVGRQNLNCRSPKMRESLFLPVDSNDPITAVPLVGTVVPTAACS